VAQRKSIEVRGKNKRLKKLYRFRKSFYICRPVFQEWRHAGKFFFKSVAGVEIVITFAPANFREKRKRVLYNIGK